MKKIVKDKDTGGDTENFLVGDRNDNWISYDYINFRYLDAVARLLLVNSESCTVAAVCDWQGKIYLSYNRTPKTSDLEKLNLIKSYVKEQNLAGMCYEYIRNNKLDFAKKVKACVINDAIDDCSLQEEVCSFVDSLIKGPELLMTPLLDYYKKLVKGFVVGGLETHLAFDALLRPLQDILKICYVLKTKEGLIESILNIEPLKNDSKTHAEINLLSTLGIKDIYMGVSRLSCADCHEVLNSSHIHHRGTHGLYYDDCFPTIIFDPPIANNTIKNTLRDSGNLSKFKIIYECLARKKIFEFRNQDIATPDFDEDVPVSTRREAEIQNLNKRKNWIKSQYESRYKLGQQADLSEDEEEGLGLPDSYSDQIESWLNNENVQNIDISQKNTNIQNRSALEIPLPFVFYYYLGTTTINYDPITIACGGGSLSIDD